MVLVNWTAAPDIDLRTTLAAGHLQNAGYRLFGKEGTRFLYYFSDNDLYQLCSWEDTRVPNPLLSELVRQLHLGGGRGTEVHSPEQKAAVPDASA